MQRFWNKEFVRPLLNPARRILAIGFLAIGVAGAIFPIIPGWPAFLVAIALLGRRDRTLRLSHLAARRTLRLLRTTRIMPIRRAGLQISQQYVQLRRTLSPHLASLERRLSV